MAGIDYVSCHSCGKRLFYDGEYEARDYMINAETTDFVICSRCYDKLVKKANGLIKYKGKQYDRD